MGMRTPPLTRWRPRVHYLRTCWRAIREGPASPVLVRLLREIAGTFPEGPGRDGGAGGRAGHEYNISYDIT